MPVALSNLTTCAVVASGKKPHSSALPVPVISGSAGCVPIGVAASVDGSTIASVNDDCVWLCPPPMNRCSVEPPGVSVEKPMPNTLSPLGEAQLVFTQLSDG